MKRATSKRPKLTVFQCIAALFAILFILSIYIDPHVQGEALGAWTANAGAATTTAQQTCVLGVGQTYIFCVVFTGAVAGTVYYNNYNAGVVGNTWIATTSITTGNAFNYPWDCQALGNVILCVSRNPSGAASCVAYYATMTATGVSSWTSTNAPPAPAGNAECPGGRYANGVNCGIYNGFEYCAGNGNPNLELVAASVSSNGFGTWTSSTQAAGVNLEACTVSATTAAIYCVGGPTGSGSNSASYCPVANGAFGTCHTGPLFSAQNYPITVQDLYCFTNINYLYCVGGYDGTNYQKTVYYAPITQTTIGAWINTNTYGNAASKLGCTVDSNAVVTCFGGFNGAGLGTGYYSSIIVGVSTSTSTTTINTMCANCGASNGTGNYLTANTLYFYSSQNVNAPGTIDNVTILLKNVHISTLTGTLYFLYFSTFNNKAPSAGNPLQLISGNTFAYNLLNNTVNQVVKTNPQTFIGAGYWFAVGVMAITTASRGSGAAGSGVSIAMISVPTSTEYQYAVGSSTPPPSFFSSTTKTSSHWDWIFYHLIYPVTIVTSTVTSTTAINGTATTTTTLTSTATTIDSTFFLQNANFPLIMFILLLPTGMLLGVTKDLTGALVGMLIGAAAIAVLIPSVRFLFLGLVLAIVALAYMVRNKG